MADLTVLDVGCGVAPVGDINCDLFINDVFFHRGSDKRYHIDVKHVPNFVVCDAQFLPFIESCFDVVVSRQVIEHIKKPFLMFSELVRVSRSFVVVETVHRRGERLHNRKERKWLNVHHINKFDFSFFRRLADLFGCSIVKWDRLSYRSFKVGFIKFFDAPYEIRIIFSKHKVFIYPYFEVCVDKKKYLESVFG